MSHAVDLSLTISSQPPSGASFPAATVSIPWSKTRQYAEAEAFSRSLSGATDQSIMPGGMTQAKCLYLRVQGAPITVKLTSVSGTDQIVPVSELLFLECTDRPLTAIKVTGTADIEVFVGGE